MPIIVWGLVGIGGLVAGGYAAKSLGDAADQTANLVKWTAAAGVVYLVYRSGVVKRLGK